MSETASAGSLVEYLRSRGQLAKHEVTVLTGGVSSETFLVETNPSRVETNRSRIVVKRALGRLRVAGEWTAKRERAMTEAHALDLLHSLTTDCELRDVDPLRHTIVMTAAPADWPVWKSVLLGDAPGPAAAAVFDLAFLQCHLILKAPHMPSRAAEPAGAARRFTGSYERACSHPVRRIGWHTACLLLARVDGLSPAGYLSLAARSSTWRRPPAWSGSRTAPPTAPARARSSRSPGSRGRLHHRYRPGHRRRPGRRLTLTRQGKDGNEVHASRRTRRRDPHSTDRGRTAPGPT